MITEKITGMSLMPEEVKKTTSRRETERTAVREWSRQPGPVVKT